VLALDQPVAAHRLDLTLLSSGGSVVVYGAAGQAPPTSFPEGWTRLGGDPDPASRHVRLALAGGSHRWYLVWFTRLPPAADDPTSYQGGISEATLRS